jgi:hypothetical protein
MGVGSRLDEFTKPIGEMTEQEIHSWREALLEDSITPRRIEYPLPADGSVTTYDWRLKAVVRTMPDGIKRLVGLRDGEMYLCEPFEIAAGGSVRFGPPMPLKKPGRDPKAKRRIG